MQTEPSRYRNVANLITAWLYPICAYSSFGVAIVRELLIEATNMLVPAAVIRDACVMPLCVRYTPCLKNDPDILDCNLSQR